MGSQVDERREMIYATRRLMYATRMRWTWWMGLLVLLMVSGEVCAAREGRKSFRLTSVTFHEGEGIPSDYTCEGADVSPPLTWSKPPEGTKSFVLISEDPDAPMGTWVHWVVYNLPASTQTLPEAFPIDGRLSDGTCQGTTSFGRTGYGGPCPPSGTHRYIFTLYALDTVLSLTPGVMKAQLEEAMHGHVLGETHLMGTYRRKNHR